MIALLLAAQVASAPPTPPRLERVLDGRGRPVATVATVERTEEGVRRTVVLVRGLLRDDLAFAIRYAAGASAPVHLVWMADRAALRVERLADGRLEATDGARTLRWFEEDAGTKTVRCGLLAVAESLDARLVPAAGDYAALKDALGETGWSEAETPLRMLRALAPVRPPGRATHKRVPLPDDDPDADALRRDAESAFTRASKTP